MKRILLAAICSLMVHEQSSAALNRDQMNRIADSLVMVHARVQAGGWSAGSAVMISETEYATACHVLLDVNAIFISRGNSRTQARLIAADFRHDLCVLEAKENPFQAKPAYIADNRLVPGDKVISAGYPRMRRLSFSDGLVHGVHRLEGGDVIQTSSIFDLGSSGGGLFDEKGQLVGILSFMASTRGPYFYSVSVKWLQSIDHNPQQVDEIMWGIVGENQPPFLNILALQADDDLSGSMNAALRWSDQEPGNMEAWMMIGKLWLTQGNIIEAGNAFNRVLRQRPDYLPVLNGMHNLFRKSGKIQQARNLQAYIYGLHISSLSGGLVDRGKESVSTQN